MRGRNSSADHQKTRVEIESPFSIEVQRHVGPAGEISVIDPLPWDGIRRCYFVHLIDPGLRGGQHAHRSLRQVFVAVSGRVSVRLATPIQSSQVILMAGSEALHVPPAVWRDYSAVGGPAILMVLASASYDESDYIRDWQEYVDWYAKSVESSRP